MKYLHKFDDPLATRTEYAGGKGAETLTTTGHRQIRAAESAMR